MPVRTIPEGRSDSTALADPASPDHANSARPCHPGRPETATVPTDEDPLSIKHSAGDCRLATGRLASHPVLGRAVAWRRNVMASLSSDAAGARQARLTGELIASRAWSAGSGPAAARWAVASAALSPVATIGGWLVAEALQPPCYSPLRSTISGLAGLGATDRWIITIALLMAGHAISRSPPACPPSGAGPDRADGRGPVQHRHRVVTGVGARFHPAAPRLDLARRGRYYGLASLHRPPGPLTTADPAGSRRGRRDGRVPRSAGLAHLRDPGRRRPGPGGAAGVRRRGDMATRRDPGAAVRRRAS